MANERVVFEVLVTDKGLKVAQKNVDNLGASVEKTGARQRAATKDATNFYDTQKKGIIGTANSTRSFSKLAETIGSSSGLVGAYATLAANIFAVSAAFNALRSASQVEQVFRGLEASGNRTGRTLTVVAEGLKQITNNAISTEQALRSTAQITAAGFGAAQVKALGQVATDTSFALGRNLTDSLDRLTRGVVKLEPELLDELGIMTKLGESSAKYAASLGKGVTQLSNFEKRQGFLNAVVDEANLKFGGLSQNAGDSTVYDKLASSFSDLTNNILNFINVAAKPLVSILAGSPLSLLGVGLLFASTIRSQLLPGLGNLTKASAKAAEAAVSLAKAQAAQTTPLTNGPKFLQVLNEKMRDGTAVSKDYEKGLISLNKSLEQHESDLAKYEAGKKKLSPSQVAKKEETLGILDAQKEAIQKVLDLEAQAATKHKATAAIDAASNREIGKSYDLIKTATQEYYQQQLKIVQSTTTVGAVSDSVLARMKAGAFAASTSIRALGAAFLNFIPLIGQVVFAFGLLQTAWDFFKSPAQKAAETAFQNLQTVAGSLDAKLKELARTNASNAPIALKTEQAIIIQANAVRELVDAYNEATKAYDDYAKNKDQKSGVAGILDSGTDRGQASRSLGIDQASKALDVFQKEFEGVATYNINGVTTETKKAAIALDGLLKSGGPATKQMIDLYGGLEAIQKLDTANKLSVIDKLVNDIGKTTGPAAERIKDLTESLKDSNLAAGAFVRGLAQSTPYDETTLKLQSVSMAIQELNEGLLRGETAAQNWTNVLGQIGPDMQKFLSLAGSNVLDKLRKNLTITPEEGRLLQNSIKDAQKLFEVNQANERLAKSELALAQARNDKMSKLYSITADGVGKRIDGENRIRSLQVKSLEIQKAIIDASILQQKQRLQTLKTEMEIVKAKQLGNREDLDSIMLQARADKLRAQAAATRASKNGSYKLDDSNASILASPSGPDGIREAAQQFNEASKLYQAAEAQLGRRNEAEGIIRGMQAELAAAQNLANQISTIMESNISAAEKAAEIAAKEVEIRNAQKTVLEEQRAILVGINSDYEDVQALINGATDSLGNQLRIIERTRNVEAERTTQARNRKITELEAQKGIYAAQQGDAKERANVLRYFDEQIDLERQGLSIDLMRITATAEIASLEKAIFDTRKEGLEWQREALGYVEKQLSAQRALSDENQKLYESQTKLAAKRRGVELSTEGENALEIKAATRAYQLAVEEVGLKKALIDLEYALLDAQRQQFMFELSERRSVLSDQNANGQFNDRINQLDSIMNRIDSVNTSQIATNLKKALDIALESQRVDLQTLATADRRGAGSFTRIRRGAEDRRAEREAQEAARSVIATAKPSELSPVIVAQQKAAETYKSSNQLLMDKITEWINKINEIIGSRGIQVPGASLSLKDAQAYSASNGVRITEAIGRNSGGHVGSGHREGRAFDASIGAGNSDVTNPAFKAKMDAQASKFQAAGLVVLWNGNRYDPTGSISKIAAGAHQHMDHMHVELAKKSASTQVNATRTVTNKAIAEIGDIEDSLNNSDILVKARRTQAPKYAEPRQGDFSGSDVNTDIPYSLGKAEPQIKNVREFLVEYDSLTAGIIENLAKLGPEGEAVAAVAAGISTIGNAATKAFETFKDSDADFTDKFTAAADVASAVLTTVQSVVASSADAKVAAIDREIAAEQKRDGKTAESIAKIQAFEKKKDQIGKKAFDTNKKLMMAQAVISTAAGVAQALSYGPIAGPILAAVIAAMGAAQLAIISGTQYQSTASNVSTPSAPQTLTIGKRGDTVDLARNNNNVGGELGYLRGSRGTGSNSSNYQVIGSAYGGSSDRGYGHTAYAFGEKGPEIMTPETPIEVRPMSPSEMGQSPVNATFNIHAMDARGMKEALLGSRGDIIGMLRDAANAEGGRFMEDVNINVYSRPNSGGTKL